MLESNSFLTRTYTWDINALKHHKISLAIECCLFSLCSFVYNYSQTRKWKAGDIEGGIKGGEEMGTIAFTIFIKMCCFFNHIFPQIRPVPFLSPFKNIHLVIAFYFKEL